ncbi:hypothetical protein Psal006a_03532 (plasmid) [Piscirickettsia salmonis]|nr:hypothetical protein Psal006a_03532 [Piscirickettsia salmonis]
MQNTYRGSDAYVIAKNNFLLYKYFLIMKKTRADVEKALQKSRESGNGVSLSGAKLTDVTVSTTELKYAIFSNNFHN